MGLYPDQEKVAEEFAVWLENSSLEDVAGLWASAGFGKSHMVKYVIDLVNEKYPEHRVLLTSMTHSAVEVLGSLTGKVVTTLHSAMRWVPAFDTKTGEEYLKTPKEPSLMGSGVTLMLVDEAGLMGHDEVKLLISSAIACNVKLLLIGDHKQCYPVVKRNQKLCIPAYDATTTLFSLTVPKRVNENDMIYKLSTRYRKSVDGGRQPNLRTIMNPDDPNKGIVVVDDIEEAAFDAFNKAVLGDYVRDVKVLAFTNNRCIRINRKIRKHVFGITDPAPFVGEELVANEHVEHPLAEVNEALIKNNQIVIVKSVEVAEQFGIPGFWLELEDIEEQVFVARNPEQVKKRRQELAYEANKLKAEGKQSAASDKWRMFYRIKKGCADLRNSYAMTVNKCQGRTLRHVLIDMYDLDTCRDAGQKSRLAYTGVTRATDVVEIEGELRA